MPRYIFNHFKLQNPLTISRRTFLIFLVICIIGIIIYILTRPGNQEEQLQQHFNFNFYAASDVLDEVPGDMNTEVADTLSRKVRVLCFFTTMAGNELKALAVNDTWAKRCTHRIFFSSSQLLRFKPHEVVYLDVPEGRDHLTEKTFEALMFLYKHHLYDYDWFLKADDDVYFIMENLRLMLSWLRPTDPIYLGHTMKRGSLRWMSGGAGYVLSRQSLKLLAEKGLPQNGGVCDMLETDEDQAISQCLQKLQVTSAYSSVDKFGRESFHAWTLEKTLFSSDPIGYSLHTKLAGVNCCSQLSISFHYIQPAVMYTLEMMLYHITIFGRHANASKLGEMFPLKLESLQHSCEHGFLDPRCSYA